jgi:threonine synthase
VRLAEGSTNPFVRYRHRLESYRTAIAHGWSDDDFVALVEELDAAVSAVDGHGFVVTPSSPEPALAAAMGVAAELWVKDDTGNVAGSHKGRHLFGLMLHLLVTERTSGGARAHSTLAIASCGNAALAAAVVAAAVERPLRVFIPTDADPAVVARLRVLGAAIEVCPRQPGEVGDPCYLRFREATASGAVPFSCQGTDAPATLDGGRTIAWELAEALHDHDDGPARLDAVFVQVGGGALASSVVRGLADAVASGWLAAAPAMHLVQTTGAHPLVRAWDRAAAVVLRGGGEPSPADELAASAVDARAERARAVAAMDAHTRGAAVAAVLADPDHYMWAWEAEPHSIAHGILDDVTYDWPDAVRAMLTSGGWPVVVDDPTLATARDLVAARTGIPADATGAAAVAGLLAAVRAGHGPAAGARVAVTVTGRRRDLAARVGAPTGAANGS